MESTCLQHFFDVLFTKIGSFGEMYASFKIRPNLAYGEGLSGPFCSVAGSSDCWEMNR